MNIQMVDLLGQYQQIEAEITQGIQQVLQNTAFIGYWKTIPPGRWLIEKYTF